MEIAYGPGGWVRVGELGPHSLFVRFMEPGVIGELFMASDQPEGITAADLRQTPLAKIAAVALAQPKRFRAEGKRDVDVRAALSRMVPPKHFGRTVDVTLDPPTQRGLDDEFLRRVADAYTSAVARGERPNKALAEQVGHDTTRTVERWVYLSRKRGFLPRGRPGANSVTATHGRGTDDGR